ncbi:hypothetical protein Tco_0833484 [Tanacetum coccineum]
MVAFLEKSTGSAGFYQIIDFLNQSHICFALTKKPEVCVSFIKQFWRSAEASTDEHGDVKINATIYGHTLSITGGSLRQHLKLVDQDGITSIPTTEIFAQLALIGYHTDSDSVTLKGTFFTSLEKHHLPIPHDSPLYAVHSHGSDEGSLKLQELMNLVTTLSDRIGVLEADLMKTKETYSSAYTKLILRVKKLESQIKIGKARRQSRVVLSDDKAFEDDSSKQGRKLADEVGAEMQVLILKYRIQKLTPTESHSRSRGKKRSRQDKGKAIIIEEEPMKKSKKDLKQERLSYAEAIRLEEQMNEEQRAQIARDEEIARQWDEEERKRAMDESKIAKKIDWNDPSVIRYHTQKMKPKTVAQARRNMIKYLKNQGNYKISDFKGIKSPEKVVEEEIDTQEELKESVKEPGAKRKKFIPRKSTRMMNNKRRDAEER